jgi:hypothetical protein
MNEQWKNWFISSTSGILAQGGPAMDGAACMYRAPNGRKCAAGQLIPDELYNPDIEGGSFYQPIMDKEITKVMPHYEAILSLQDNMKLTESDIKFISDLQSAHDGSVPINSDDPDFSRDFFRKWEKKLENLAMKNGFRDEPEVEALFDQIVQKV